MNEWINEWQNCLDGQFEYLFLCWSKKQQYKVECSHLNSVCSDIKKLFSIARVSSFNKTCIKTFLLHPAGLFILK